MEVMERYFDAKIGATMSKNKSKKKLIIKRGPISTLNFNSDGDGEVEMEKDLGKIPKENRNEHDTLAF